MPDHRLSVVMPILINHDWQVPMTRCAIETLALCAAQPFQLIVSESARHRFDPECHDDLDFLVDNPKFTYTYVYRDYHVHNKNPTADINAGLDQATAPICVYTGNDVFVRPEWDEALLECFAVPACGMATLASADLAGTPPSAVFGQRVISEGIYGPFCAFRSTERFDARNFPSSFADSDMIVRHYRRGLRMYRNNRVVIQHLNQQTINGPDHLNDFEAAKRRFVSLHSDLQTWAFQFLAGGMIV